MLGSFWTLANVLSIVRVPLSVGAAILIISDASVVWSLGIILIAALTDVLDGFIARSTNTVSGWGKILDPAADKLSIAILGVVFVLKNLLPLWFVGVVLLRDLLILTGGVFLGRRTGQIHMSNITGKLAVIALSITFVLGLLRADQSVMDISLWTTVGFLGLSFVVYATRLFNLRHLPPPH
ncbi:MAG: CDP-alcohol phosphatidyltransferase family protein [Bacteroidetes bacterium]|nr:CDP-alcohol phosphatidyltransferase family protein [Bacteroidota bacterium]MCY4225180.1 CDP-alcohol phosphatidyltransferase family protein [Bacteroidota bacterium]